MTAAELIVELQKLPPDTVVAIDDEDTHWSMLAIGLEYSEREKRVYLTAVGGYPAMEKPA